MSKKTKKDSEIQGLSHLIFDATIGVTDLVEAIQKQIITPPFLPSTSIQKLITSISSITHKNIRWSTLFIGKSLHKILEQLAPTIGNLKSSDKKEVILSALNGVIGDYLEEKNNPLKINMQFRFQSKALKIDSESLKATYPTITGKILLMLHGSCMNDTQWTRKNHNHGEILSTELNKTLVYLNYNSGKHISTNGQNLSNSLDELLKNWPVPVEELIMVAHSMGGLIARSALYYGQQDEKKWTKYLKKVVFLGTPHHGSHVERTGNYLDVILEAIPYAKPFAKLGKIRSAGITDLRYGNLVNKDWQNKDRFELKNDQRQHVPLPKQVGFYAVAAVNKKENSTKHTLSLGDNLVSIKSALGQHKILDKTLVFKKNNIWIGYETNHLDLLSSPKITEILKIWLA